MNPVKVNTIERAKRTQWAVIQFWQIDTCEKASVVFEMVNTFGTVNFSWDVLIRAISIAQELCCFSETFFFVFIFQQHVYLPCLFVRACAFSKLDYTILLHFINVRSIGATYLTIQYKSFHSTLQRFSKSIDLYKSQSIPSWQNGGEKEHFLIIKLKLSRSPIRPCRLNA